MARELSTHELEELLGPYALDAVDDDEREQVEQYLERNAPARELVAEYRETAALLAHGGTEAPPDLWERIERTLEEEPPRLTIPPAAMAVARPSRRSVLMRRVAVGVAAAAALLVVGALTVKVLQQDDRIDELGQEAKTGSVLAAADAASRDPHATTIRLSSTDGSREARIVYLPDGGGFLLDDNLAPLPADRTYQLWALMSDAQGARPISAGVLGRDPGVAAFRARGPVAGFAITEEQTPGVATSGNPAVVQGAVD